MEIVGQVKLAGSVEYIYLEELDGALVFAELVELVCLVEVVDYVELVDLVEETDLGELVDLAELVGLVELVVKWPL